MVLEMEPKTLYMICKIFATESKDKVAFSTAWVDTVDWNSALMGENYSNAVAVLWTNVPQKSIY
jgi:hypothetical protein